MPEDSSDDSLESLFAGSPSSSSGPSYESLLTSEPSDPFDLASEEETSTDVEMQLSFLSGAVLLLAAALIVQTALGLSSLAYVLAGLAIAASLVRIVKPKSALLEKALEAVSEAAEEPDA